MQQQQEYKRLKIGTSREKTSKTGDVLIKGKGLSSKVDGPKQEGKADHVKVLHMKESRVLCIL